MSGALPNFFLVGASKAGSTSLHYYLGQHPDVFMSPIKEPHFLADEVRPENFSPEMRRKIEAREPALQEFLRGPACEPFSGGPITNGEDYARLFQCAGAAKIRGESSPCYLWSATAPGNIAREFPDAKIAMILRNPVERAFAQHAHMLMFAERAMTFREHLDAAVASRDTRISELYPFLEFGLYGAQVRRYLALFPREQVRVCFYEDLLADPAGFVRGMFEFLGVDSGFAVDTNERHMKAFVPRSFGLNRALRQTGLWDAAKALLPGGVKDAIKGRLFRQRAAMAMSADERQWLVDYYREDVVALAELTGRDLSGWLACDSASTRSGGRQG